jgi:hypothetical protein
MGPAKVAEKIQRNRFHIRCYQFKVASRADNSSRVRLYCSPVDMFLSV